MDKQIQVTLNWKWVEDGEGFALNVLDYGYSGNMGSAILDGFATFFGTNVLEAWLPIVSSGLQLWAAAFHARDGNSVYILHLDQTDFGEMYGGAVTEILPQTQAYHLTKVPYASARMKPGHIYIAGVTDGGVRGNRVASTTFDDLYALGQGLLATFSWGGCVADLCIRRTRPAPELQLVEKIGIDPVVRSMRSRLPGRGV